MTSASNTVAYRFNAHKYRNCSRDFTWRVRENYLFSNFHVAKKKTRVEKAPTIKRFEINHTILEIVYRILLFIFLVRYELTDDNKIPVDRTMHYELWVLHKKERLNWRIVYNIHSSSNHGFFATIQTISLYLGVIEFYWWHIGRYKSIPSCWCIYF